jgi:hypothetical protein
MLMHAQLHDNAQSRFAPLRLDHDRWSNHDQPTPASRFTVIIGDVQISTSCEQRMYGGQLAHFARNKIVKCRGAIAGNDLTHNDSAIDERLDGSRARPSELTQAKATHQLDRCAGLEQHQRTAPAVSRTST